MDLQILLVAFVIFVVCALLVYLISVFGMREKTFEEVMAEQKRRQEEETLKNRSEKKAEKDSKKKWNRRKQVQAKDKSPGFTNPEPIVETPVLTKAKVLEYEPEPEIINPDDFPIKEHKPSKPKGKKAKSILVNKNEKAPVGNDVEAPPLYHKSIPPKDEVELKHKPPKEEQSSSKHSDRVSKTELKIAESSTRVVEETVLMETYQTSAAVNSNMVKSSDKKKSKGGVGDAENSLSTSRLISSVRSATLSDVEVQAMIDILLNKQQGGSAASLEAWSKKSQKGDPVTLLRKQLEEKERALQEEQQLAMAANNKLKEVKQEMAQEKSRYTSLEKNTRDKMALQTKEIQALHARMQQTHETHMVEKTSLQARVSQMENQMGPGNQNLLQKLTDENKQLKDSLNKLQSEIVPPSKVEGLNKKVNLLQTELSNSHIKLNAAENSKKTLEAKVAKYEEQLRAAGSGQDTEAVLTKKLDEVSQQLRKSESQKGALSSDMQKAQSECQALKSQLRELERTLSGANENTKGLQAKLEASEQQKVSLQTSIQSLEQKLEGFSREHGEKEAELNKLRVENRSLNDQLRRESERQQGEGQEEPSKPDGAPNGHIDQDADQEKQSLLIKEHERLISEKEKEISRLSSDLNGKLDEITRLSEEVEKQKKKNNEIREKNWKAMEALDKAEKSVQEKIGQAVKTATEKESSAITECEKYDKSVLQRLFPDISPQPSLEHKDWMTSFEKEAMTFISEISSKANTPAVDPAVDKKLQESESRCADLETRLREAEDETNDVKQRLRDAEETAENAENRAQELESRLSEGSSPNIQETESLLHTAETRLLEVQTERDSLQSWLKIAHTELKEAQSSSSQSSALEKRLQETEEQRDRLEAQIKEYRNVLSETEDKLQQLQTSVESEEQNWMSRVQQTESELSKTRSELTVLKEEYSKSAGSNEMEEKIGQLEAELEVSVDKYSTVQGQLSEAQSKISSLEVQLSQNSSTPDLKEKLNSMEQQVNLLTQEKAEAEARVIEKEEKVSSLMLQIQEGGKSDTDLILLKKQISEFQVQLEGEKKRSKDLSSTVVRLNATVKIGQDALAEEQRLVKQLQDQLSLKNGTGPEDADSLKGKLADTQKQLEREIMANRQLSQRLAASAGNDVGTSV